MSAAGSGSRSSGRSAGRLQTLGTMAIAAVVLGVLVYAASGQGPSDGVTQIDLGGGAAAAAPAVGAVPPDFTAVTWEGKTVSLSDYAGKPVWLTFGASWCADCRTEAPDLEATYLANKDQGLVILGVFIQESKEDVGGYAQRAGLTFPIAVDERAAIAGAFRTMGIPTHFFIGPDGKIREIRIGALPRDEMDRVVASLMN
ncbi:MAG: TlpA disulfide reductase family protein [Chloroflexota bacterium]|nr:TlpA disulfide reductase family protein [Chloroflexota bacterium]